jgi:chromate transporter
MSGEASAGRVGEVFTAFLKLGLTSFGGPIAHLGYFRDELVVRRKWLDETAYADLVALCQFLPGPASSQVGFSLGILRGNGLLGGLAAWFAFTMPSALILFAFAKSAAAFTGPVAEGFLHGLKLVAVAVVAQAIWGICRERSHPIVPAPASRLPRLQSLFSSPDRSGRFQRLPLAPARAFGSAEERSRRSPDI